MSTQSANPAEKNYTDEQRRFLHRANQAWEMVGLARQNGDKQGEKRHTDGARGWERKIVETLLKEHL